MSFRLQPRVAVVLKALFIASMLALPCIGQNHLEGSYVVVRDARPRKAKGDCVLTGKVKFNGRKDVPRGFFFLAVKGIADGTDRLVADDVMDAVVDVEKSGAFELRTSVSDFPLVVTAVAPDFQPATVVLETCNVSLDFHLAAATPK